MKLNACYAPPDLGLDWGLQQLEKPAAAPRSSARRQRHATKATNSFATLGSLQGLPGPTRRQEGEPPGDTRALFSPGRSAATIAARGQGLLWGTTATQTRHATGEQTPPGTQPNAYSRTRTQRNALGRNATWTQRNAETRTQTRCKDADTNQRETTQ